MGRPLKKEEQEQLTIDVKDNTMTSHEIMTKYNISDVTLRTYRRKLGIKKSKPKSLIQKEKKLIDEKGEYQLEIVGEEKMNTEEEKDIDIKKEDLIETPKTETKTYELDPSKDYCSTCYKNGRIIEIKKGIDEQCPVCKAVLNWG